MRDRARRGAPHHLWLRAPRSSRPRCAACDGQHVGQQFVTQQERQQAQVEQLGVRRPVVVLLQLHSRVVEVDDLGAAHGIRHLLRQLVDSEKVSVNWLKTRNSPVLRRVPHGQLDARQRVTDVEKPT